jgi:hypothetical protein
LAKGKSTGKANVSVTPAKGRSVDLQAATGTEVAHLQLHMIDQVAQSLWLREGLSVDQKFERIKSAVAMVEGIKPDGGIEGLLAAQMVATPNAAMDCLGRAMIRGQTFEGRDQSLKHAAKLLSIYTRQVEVLDKRRGKGQQKVTVEYVNVEAGGQAIVGHVETGGRKRRRKSQSPAIEHAPEVPLETFVEQPATVKAATGKKRG